MSEAPYPIGSLVLDPTREGFSPACRIADMGHVHFVGIGGAGMSVLAEMLHGYGIEVSGSDRAEGAGVDRLRGLGIMVEIGHDAAHVRDAGTVVYSSAIKPDNPEIVEAVRRGLHVVHRSDILSLLMASKRSVTVAGTHGKTTTSSMLSHVLSQAEGELADSSYAIGGSIQGADGVAMDGGHAGVGRAMVAEADESDGSFLKYRPDVAIITNVEADHLDHYGTVERYREAFVRHAQHARDHVVVCADDAGCREVLRAVDAGTRARAIAYTADCGSAADAADGLGDVALVRIEDVGRGGDGGERFTLRWPADLGPSGREAVTQVSLGVPGMHNVRNATAALIAAHALGMDDGQAARAIAGFLGAVRRFQLRGSAHGVDVVDDYAHHPTEIEALLDAARRRYPQSCIHVLFQPHLFSRTAFFADQFARALSKADDVVVCGVYPARERQEDFPGVGADTIVRRAEGLKHGQGRGQGRGRLHDGGAWITAMPDMRSAARELAMRAVPGDVICTVGAGDVTTMGPVIMEALRGRGQCGREGREG